MDPVTIALAISATKSLLNTATDATDIASSLNHLFKQTEKKPKKQKTKTKWQSFFGNKAGADDDMSEAMADVISQREIQEQLASLQVQIERRFPGAWQEILDARDLRKAERKKQIQIQRQKEQAEKDWWDHAFQILLEFGKFALLILFVSVIAWLVWANRAGADIWN